MTGSGRRFSRRLRRLMCAFALVAGAGSLVAVGFDAQAQQGVEMTMMFTGSVGGKIAPCG